jgi:cell division protein FtsB
MTPVLYISKRQRSGVIVRVLAISEVRRILATLVLVLHSAVVNFVIERFVPLGMLLVAAVSVPVMLWSPSGLSRLEALRSQRETLQLEVARLEREIERLRHEAESIKTSPSSIERVARDELGLVRRTELVMQFKQE